MLNFAVPGRVVILLGHYGTLLLNKRCDTLFEMVVEISIF